MCYPASESTAQAFAAEVRARFPNEVQSARVVRTGRRDEWFPNADVEVHIVASAGPEELRPKVQALVGEYVIRDDVWVEVRIAEETPAQDFARREGAVRV